MKRKNVSGVIAKLDLEPIKVKLMHAESGEAWSQARVDAVDGEYRRFLHLMKKFPDEQLAPLADVDLFWHYHILDTMKYAADCEQIFGYFLHHCPYLGLRGVADQAARQGSGERMRMRYQETFGGGDSDAAAPAEQAGHAFCAVTPQREGHAFCAAVAQGAGQAFCAAPAAGAFCAAHSGTTARQKLAARVAR